jgi:hypothetical protein
MTKLITHATAALAFACGLGVVSSARADDMRVSGSSYLTQVESHALPAAGDPTHVFTIDKWVGATISPGWFGGMQFTAVGANLLDLKAGTGDTKGTLLWASEEGTIVGSYVSKASFTVDNKTSAPKGTYEATFEFTSGTGRYADVRGHGTVKGEFSGGTATDHWTGTVTSVEKHASTQ